MGPEKEMHVIYLTRKVFPIPHLFELCHEKNNVWHMRKQRRRSASR